jgi:pimeloyl-ACP methyl ester carboxylesterase
MTDSGKFTTSDGVAIAWYRWGPANAGTPVVLHHGYAASALTNWVATGVVDALVAAGRNVIALDARGHGQSDKPHDAAAYGESRMATDLAALLAHLGVRRFDLFGYSMGGIVSLIAASRGADVRRLIVGGIGEGVIECGGVDARVLDRGALVAAMLADDAASVAHPAVAAFRLFAEALGNDLAALAAQARSFHATPIALDRIDAPTLVIAGEDDALAVRPQTLANAIPHATLAMVPGDHLGAVRQPAFVEAALRFLAVPSETERQESAA